MLAPVLAAVVLCSSAALLLHVAAAEAEAVKEDLLIGWQGETYHEGNETRGREPWIETISWQPRAFIYHGFMSHQECDELIRIATARLARSQVVDDNGKDAVDPIRTSYSASLTFHEGPLIASIEERIAAWTHLPMSHGEPIEVLRYNNHQRYLAHWDWFGKDADNGDSGDRVATVLMYLADLEPDAGGETCLPLGIPIDPELQSTEGMSKCATIMGMSIRPRKGDTLLFWDALPDSVTSDRRALHSSCPTLKGNKWTATKWIHVRPFLTDHEVKLGLERKAKWQQQGQLWPHSTKTTAAA